MSTKADRGAVLQFEMDRKRWAASETYGMYDETQAKRIRHLIQTTVMDTGKNGGTFVLVATTDKVTMVQRPDAEEMP